MAKTGISIAMLLWLLSAAPGRAQQTVSKANMVHATATIQAIDSTARRLTLRNDSGEEQLYIAGPEVQRFDQLKVGDKVRMTYYESIVFQLRKPGDKANPKSDEAALTRAKGVLPGATIATQEKRTVTVTAVDPAASSITVRTEDGRTVTRKVDDKKNLTGVSVGDRVDITYTEALLTGVERAN